MNGKTKVLMSVIILSLVAVPAVVSAKRKGIEFSPDYGVTFDGDIAGSGLVEVTGYFLKMSSNVAENDVILEFSETFEEAAGEHTGYLHMERTSKNDPTVEIFYTYEEGDAHYHLHGLGTFEGDKKAGWFTIHSTGTFTIEELTNGWSWEGEPEFTIDGAELE